MPEPRGQVAASPARHLWAVNVAPTAAFRAPLRDGPSTALGGSLRTDLVFSWRTEGLGLVDTQLIASCAQVGVRAVRGTEDLCSVIPYP